MKNAEEAYDAVPELWEGKNIADFVDPDILVKLDRLLVFDQRTNSMIVLTSLSHLSHVIVRQGTEVLGDCGVVIGEVMGVEDNSLPVYFGIANAEGPGELEIGPRQCSGRLSGVDQSGEARDHFLFDNADESNFL